MGTLAFTLKLCWLGLLFCVIKIVLSICIYRTKEQLGYVVECSPRVTYRVFGFCFCVQSSEYSPIYLQGRIDNFINDLEELLVSILVLSLLMLLSLWFFLGLLICNELSCSCAVLENMDSLVHRQVKLASLLRWRWLVQGICNVRVPSNRY